MKSNILKEYPNAFSYHWRDSWTIYNPMGGRMSGNTVLGNGKTARLAWRDAFTQLEAERAKAKGATS